MRLSELQNNDKREKFVSDVVKDAKKRLQEEISTNRGLENSNEILTLIRQGESVDFDYNVLIECAEGL